MAYIDQRTDRNQRAVAMGLVAVLQGAAIVALINGLAVHFTRTAPLPPTQATDVPTTIPLPTPIPTPQATKSPLPQPKPDWTPVPQIGGGTGPTTVPSGTLPADPVPTPTYEPPAPQPKPMPSFTPRSAKPRNAPSGWVTPNDYPTRDLREGNQGVAGFLLSIGVDGRVESCSITRSSGFAGLDKATCEVVSRRARFEPATDGDGNRISSSYSGTIRWQIPRD